MNTNFSVIFYTLAILVYSMSSCTKSKFPTEVELDYDIELGKSRIYLNGDIEESYMPDFLYVSFYNTMLFHFNDEPEEWLWNTLSFSGLSGSIGNYNILEDGTVAGPPNTTFTQTYQEDLQGYTYRLINKDDAYFEIFMIDTIKQEVKGSFKAIFERTSKNGHSDLGLPKILLFQGVFYEKYEDL